MDRICVYDTTLRDGTQGEGISLTVQDKIKIARQLDRLGVDYIEAGWPGSNPKDMEFFLQAKQLKLAHAKIVAFGSTRRVGTSANEDSNLQSLLDSNVDIVTIFGKTWDFQVTEALRTDLDTNLQMIQESISFLVSRGLRVFFDAEHFFDGYRSNPTYALNCLQAANNAGAECLILCDTNGGLLPFEIEGIVRHAVSLYGNKVGIHTHNDGELGVANTLAAVQAGAAQVQGTVNGWGERSGNANLCSILPNLILKMNLQCLNGRESLTALTEIAHYVNEIGNVIPNLSQPFVGGSAFAHKAGMHVNAIAKNARTYEHIAPEEVGNQRRILISELAAGDNVVYKAQALGFEVNRQSPEMRQVLTEIKDLEYQGYQFEGAEASFELRLHKTFGKVPAFFELVGYRVTSFCSAGDEPVSEAVIKLKVGHEEVHTAAEGHGPVNALDHALRKALTPFYPCLESIQLVDYKVRVLDGKDGTSAKVRVLMEHSNKEREWTTVGVSENILEASWEALVDAIYFLLLSKQDDQQLQTAN
ncbi:MAG: transferase [Bacilli bacterium]|nr:transferase [Bacilli bacterium]